MNNQLKQIKQSNQSLIDNLNFLQTHFPVLAGTRILLAGFGPQLRQAREFLKEKGTLVVLVDLEEVFQTKKEQIKDLKEECFALELGESCLDLALLLPGLDMPEESRERLIEAMLRALKSQARWVNLGIDNEEIMQSDLKYLQRLDARNLLMYGEPGKNCFICCLPPKRL